MVKFAYWTCGFAAVWRMVSDDGQCQRQGPIWEVAVRVSLLTHECSTGYVYGELFRRGNEWAWIGKERSRIPLRPLGWVTWSISATDQLWTWFSLGCLWSTQEIITTRSLVYCIISLLKPWQQSTALRVNLSLPAVAPQALNGTSAHLSSSIPFTLPLTPSAQPLRPLFCSWNMPRGVLPLGLSTQFFRLESSPSCFYGWLFYFLVFPWTVVSSWGPSKCLLYLPFILSLSVLISYGCCNKSLQTCWK